jgi:hypothetical protein
MAAKDTDWYNFLLNVMKFYFEPNLPPISERIQPKAIPNGEACTEASWAAFQQRYNNRSSRKGKWYPTDPILTCTRCGERGHL